MKPLFSIITPTHNRGYILWKTIQGVQQQIYPHWELLIIDDGSTDDTKRVVAQFQHDPRILYKKLHKGNANKARNYGLKHAKGDFIVYLDSDDYLYDNFLSVNREFFTKYREAVFAISNYNRRIELYDDNFKLVNFTDSDSEEKKDMKLEDIYLRKVKGSGSGLVHKRLAIEKGLQWDESLQLFEDWDFKMKLGRVFPNGFVHIPYVLFEYLQQYGGDGVCSNASYGEWAVAFEQIYQKHKNDPLLQGQTWYPERVEKYKQLQKDFEKGKVPAPVYKYFPEFRKAKKK